jgi:hypothetical protein
VSEPEASDRFRRLPEPVPLEVTVETVDTTAAPAPDAADERERLLREAGG